MNGTPELQHLLTAAYMKSRPDVLQRLEAVLAELKPKHRHVIVRRFGLDGEAPGTLREIAKELTLSGGRVGQIEHDTLRRIGDALRGMPRGRGAPHQEALAKWEDLRNISIDECELSVRSYNCLRNANVKTVFDLVNKTEFELLKTKNFGRKSLNEIKDLLGDHGLTLTQPAGGTTDAEHAVNPLSSRSSVSPRAIRQESIDQMMFEIRLMEVAARLRHSFDLTDDDEDPTDGGESVS